MKYIIILATLIGFSFSLSAQPESKWPELDASTLDAVYYPAEVAWRNYLDADQREVKPKMKEETKGCSANYYKNASRIYNNSDWINATNSYQHEKYNYDKLSPCSAENNSTNYLLPCIQPEANKIPQTLNNLLYSKKSKDDNEACPIEVNNPWSSYKSGDDIDSNKILPEGYNI